MYLALQTSGLWLNASGSQAFQLICQKRGKKMHIENVFLLYDPSVTAKKKEKKPSGFC